MSRFTFFTSLLFVTATGCGMDDDDIWMPPSSGGKADGVTILKGSDIPSQFVSANKHYLTGRAIESLRKVGALTGVPDGLATRADGIIANLPANGRIEAAELVRMESSAIYPSLFPDEQAALPELWKHLLAPTPNATPAAAPPMDLATTEQITEPGGLTFPTSILISSLPSELQTVAKRVELLHNGDSNANTIQIADIDPVLLDPQAFTPAEVDQLQNIKIVFMERATSVEDAKVVVPTPGHQETNTSVGALGLQLEATVALTEQRSWQRSDYYLRWLGTLAVELDLTATLHGTMQDKVIFIDLETGGETVLEGAAMPVPAHGAGDFVVERYAGGQRQETHDVALTAFVPGHSKTDISKYLDFRLVTANQSALAKNVIATSFSNNYEVVDFRHEAMATPPPPTAHQSYIDDVAMPKLTLPTGRYEVPLSASLGTLIVDVYPQNVILVSYGGTTNRLVYDALGYPNFNKILSGGVGPLSLRFDPANNELVWSTGGQGVPVRLNVTLRTK